MHPININNETKCFTGVRSLPPKISPSHVTSISFYPIYQYQSCSFLIVGFDYNVEMFVVVVMPLKRHYRPGLFPNFNILASSYIIIYASSCVLSLCLNFMAHLVYGSGF